MAKMCMFSRLERQFATLCLFHAPMSPPPPTPLPPRTPAHTSLGRPLWSVAERAKGGKAGVREGGGEGRAVA